MPYALSHLHPKPISRDSLSYKLHVKISPLVLYLTFRLGIIFTFR